MKTHSIRGASCRTLFVLALTIGVTCRAGAQPSPVLGFGVAIPAGPLGEERYPGPLVRLGLAFRSPTRSVQFRLEGELTYLPGAGEPGSWNGSDLTSLAALGNVTIGGRGETSPYWLLGLGVQRLIARGLNNPYGMTPGLRTGLGVRLKRRTTPVSLEVLAHLNVTDFAAGDFEFGYFFPVVASLRF